MASIKNLVEVIYSLATAAIFCLFAMKVQQRFYENFIFDFVYTLMKYFYTCFLSPTLTWYFYYRHTSENCHHLSDFDYFGLHFFNTIFMILIQVLNNTSNSHFLKFLEYCLRNTINFDFIYLVNMPSLTWCLLTNIDLTEE